MTSRACRALLALALFLGAGSLLPGSARAADAPAAKAPVVVGISEVTPQIPDFTDLTKTMTFSGRVQNTKSTALKGVTVELRRTLVNSRSDLAATAGGGFNVQAKPVPPKFPELAPNATADWKFTLTEQELFNAKKPYPGVYAIDVDARDSDGTFLGGQRTYVVWKPVANGKKSRIALLWPVVGQPGLTGQKTANDAAAPIVADPQAAEQYKPNGRLDTILRDGQQFPVNWILDPDVLYTANQLSNGYFVTSADGSPKPEGGDGGQAAKDWYNAAHTLFSSPQTQNCWNLPYADPDLTTLAHTAVGQPLLSDAVKLQPPAIIGGCRRPGTVAWPADGQADAATLKALQAAGLPAQLTLLSSNAVTTAAWKSAYVSLPQSPNTVVYDTSLSGLFTDPAPPAGQPQLNAAGVLSGQLWLAQTALLAADDSDRILVVAPPRDFTPSPPLVSAISGAEKMAPADKWVGLDDLGKVLDGKPGAAPSSPLVAKSDTPNLPADVVNTSSDSRKLYQALHSVMDGSHDSDGAVPYRPVATWWRTHAGGPAFTGIVYNTVVAEHGLVSLGPQQQTLTMSGKSGTVPVTITNKTNSTIRVYLQAVSKQSVQLKVARNQGQQTVASGQSATVHIRVEGEGNGQKIDLVATLFTCSDLSVECTYYPTDLITPLKPDKGYVTIPVKVSRIGIIALGLMIGSGVLLVALIGLRVYRAKRAQHASAQDTMAR